MSDYNTSKPWHFVNDRQNIKFKVFYYLILKEKKNLLGT